ncbi:ANK1 [Symbiodinium natans]|uniref:ANK1 protein n=1 Tax=Symbiodinium natans TaxID=878477 RepID=A0A812NH17_9DINO|nr:ANK1 [Symbiodinium natans]
MTRRLCALATSQLLVHVRGSAGEALATPLMYAAKHGYREAVQALLDHRAEVETEDEDGFTPLMWAARFGHPEVVEILLEHGARVEAQNPSGWTSLSLAVTFDHPEVVHALLRADALDDPWVVDAHTGAPLWTEIHNETLRSWWQAQMSTSSLALQSLRRWETYAAFGGGMAAAAAFVAAQRGIDPEHAHHPFLEDDFHQGARLMVAKALQPTTRSALLKAFRVLEVYSNVVFVFGTMMLQKWWVFFLPVTFAAYWGPAVCQWPLSKLHRSPALAFAVRGPGSVVFALLRLAALFGLWISSWAPANPLLGQVMLKWSSAWAEQSLLQELPVDRVNLSSAQDVLSPLHLNATATQGTAATFLGSLDLYFFMTFFLYLTIVLLAAYVASLLCHLVKTARQHTLHSQAAVESLASDSETADMVRRVLGESPDDDEWPEEVVPEEACNMSLDSVYARMCLYLMDMLLDLNTIYTLTASRNFKFAFALTAIVFRTVFQELFYGSPGRIREAVEASIARGILRNDLLNLLNEEKGFEGVFSLALTSYSFNYCVLTPSQGLTQLFSIALSAYGVASFLYEQVDLNLAEDQEHAAQDDEPSVGPAP